MIWQKFLYEFGGLVRRVYQKRVCPSCESSKYKLVDCKGFYQLLRCGNCKLLYRWPYETQADMGRFYQRKYRQAGMTTGLPDKIALDHLVTTGFKGSEKDFSHIVDLLKILSVPPDARILDFGANWGYGVWQFKQAGFSAIGYELSEPRAKYSKNLGVDVFTDWSEIEAKMPFDVVFSSHVLEHISDPARALRKMMAVLSPNGWLIALFPNGSEVFQKVDPKAFHLLWGRVHPVMLNEKFIREVLPGSSLATGACCSEDLEKLKVWNGVTAWIGTLSTGEMLIVWTPSETTPENIFDA